MPSLFTFIAALCALLAVAGTAYFVLCIWAAKRFVRERSRETRTGFSPPGSILRSLKGLDPQMYLAFRSHCLLDYGEYEVLFGVSDPSDPALELVRSCKRNFRFGNCEACIVRKCSGSTARSAILCRCYLKPGTNTSPSTTATSWFHAITCCACLRPWRSPKWEW